MISAPLRDNEAAALQALIALDVLDSAPESEFDALAHAAAMVCGVPMALVSFIDFHRQWFKAAIGFEVATETPRNQSFCAYAVLSDDLFVIEDAEQDSRFADSTFVTGEPHVRFYAGAPLRLSNGMRIGTLCVMDRIPRQLSSNERFALERLAIAVVRALEGRHAVRGTKVASQFSTSIFGARNLVDIALTNVDKAMKQLFDADFAGNPSQSAMHYCLTSAVVLLGITHRLLDPGRDLAPWQREQAWKQLAEDTKVAGRAAYRAALALADPLADRELARGD